MHHFLTKEDFHLTNVKTDSIFQIIKYVSQSGIRDFYLPLANNYNKTKLINR